LQLFIADGFNGSHIHNRQYRIAFHVGVAQGNALAGFYAAFFCQVDYRHGPEQAAGSFQIGGHAQRIGEVHIACQGVEVTGAEHHRIGGGSRVEQQGGQGLCFLNQLVVCFGVVDKKRIEGVGTVGFDHVGFSCKKCGWARQRPCRIIQMVVQLPIRKPFLSR